MLTDFARYINVPEIEIMINFDVPTVELANGQRRGDPETYIKRIGLLDRIARQISKPIAVTIYDREEDKKYWDEITEHYGIKSKMLQLKGPDHLQELCHELHEI